MLELFLRGRLPKDLSHAERLALEATVSRTVSLAARKTLVKRGDRLEYSYYLVEGYMLRHLENDRGQRQLIQVSVPGDFVDLHAFAMKRLDHSVEALTRVTLAEVPHTSLAKVVADRPHLARALWFATLLDAAMHREWIFCMGRLAAEARIAHLIVELIERLRMVDLFVGGILPIPMLQRDFAEATGISAVHANRCFSVLQDRGAVAMLGEGRLQIINEEILRDLSQFDGTYLYGEGELALHTLADE